MSINPIEITGEKEIPAADWKKFFDAYLASVILMRGDDMVDIHPEKMNTAFPVIVHRYFDGAHYNMQLATHLIKKHPDGIVSVMGHQVPAVYSKLIYRASARTFNTTLSAHWYNGRMIDVKFLKLMNGSVVDMPHFTLNLLTRHMRFARQDSQFGNVTLDNLLALLKQEQEFVKLTPLQRYLKALEWSVTIFRRNTKFKNDSLR